MTPTASSSPIVLLTPAAASGATVLAGAAQPAPDAGLSGFELLLGAMQQLQLGLPAATAHGDAESDSAPAEDGQDGNALPQPGMLLPVCGKANGAADALPIDSGADQEPAKKERADDGGAAMPLFVALQPPVLANVKVAVEAGAAQNGANPAHNSAGEIAVLPAAGELAAQIAAVRAGAGVGEKDNGAAKIDRHAVSLNSGALSERVAAGSANIADSGVLAPEIPDIAALAESDFDSLIKHFETSPAPQPTAAPAGAGDNAAAHRVSRTYSNAMGASAAIPVPVGSDAWSDAVADKVMWFSANKISSAEIHLNPSDLGPLQVRVSTQQDQASVVFTSQHAAVRDALDQALPRLRDMMGNQGMQLLDVSVGSQTPQQQQQQFARGDSAQNGTQFAGLVAGDDEAKAANVTLVDTLRIVRTGVDAYV